MCVCVCVYINEYSWAIHLKMTPAKVIIWP